MTNGSMPVAGTVLLLRDSAAGPETLLIERPDRGSFAGAWVFPGGKVEPADGDGPEVEVARRAGARETREEVGLRVDAAALTALSCWTPPLEAPHRVRTWFFVAPAPAGEIALAADEAVSAAWLRPGDALARHAAGALRLFPPTWMTLHDLAAHDDVEAVLAGVSARGVQDYATSLRRDAGGLTFLWAGDAEHGPDGGRARGEHAASARHRLETATLPWVLTRTD